MTLTATRFETVTIAVCTDCAVLFANGETEGVGESCDWSDLPHDHYHDSDCWNPTPDEIERREARFVAAIDHLWPAGWTISLGCPETCEYCHGGRPEVPCRRCGHGEWPGEVRVLPSWSTLLDYGAREWTDCPDCEGQGFTVDDSTSVDQCEPGFSWSSCDGCGSHLGGDRHPAVAMREAS